MRRVVAQKSVKAWWVAVAALGMVVSISATASAANIAGPRQSALERLENGDAIRHRLLLRGGRFDITPSLGFTLNDAFRRNILFGAQLSYHLSDSFAVGATVMGGLGLDSSLADRIKSERPERAKNGAYTDVKLLGSLERVYTPLVGKFAALGRYVFAYDMHALLGGGVIMTGGDSNLDDVPIAPVVGLGMRVFFEDWMSVTVQVRDYIYSSALNAVPSAGGTGALTTETTWANNFALTFGVGFYFPKVPKLSD